jgi:outer membrane protein assembly factor BamA
MRDITIMLSAFLLISTAVCWGESADGNRYRISAFPIAMYDSDVGFGFGGKAVIKDSLKQRALDTIIFGSTKGEQWFALAFSTLDSELRRGRRFGLALDMKLEFDKRIKSNFFGIGNESKDNEYQFPRESFKIDVAISHGFSATLSGTLGFRYLHHSVYDFDTTWHTILPQTPGAGECDLAVWESSLLLDTRDSGIDPRRGIRIYAGYEQAARMMGGDWDFGRFRLETSCYTRVSCRNDVFAVRWWMQDVFGTAPYQELSKIGDGWTARGYKADRFLDKAMALTSAEYRFPIYKKLGGVIFSDAGRVWRSLSGLSLDVWHADWGMGLRYCLANFVARADAGHSVEGTRIFFNFGHVF